jgi:CRISPR/Cas system-associated exonuclease Cas4 (RecB family)
MDHHPSLSPSSFPALAQCSCFKSGGSDSTDASLGRKMHEYCACLAKKDPYMADDLDTADRQDCEFIVKAAMDLIETNCPGSPIEIEKQVTLFDDDLNVVTFGTADVTTHSKDLAVVLDYKSALDFDVNGHNYREQLAVYALCVMREQNLPRALCIEVYIKPQKLYPYFITREEADAIVEFVIRRQADPDRKPSPCNYCKWCGNMLTCSAINSRMALVAESFAALPAIPAKLLAPETISDPTEMARCLIFATVTMNHYIKRLVQVADAIEAAAMAMSDAGTAIPDFKRVEKEGNKKIRDPQKAFDAVGLPAEDFFKAVSVSLPKLAEAYGEKNGLSVKEARKTVEKLAASAIGLEKPKKSLEWINK